MTEPVGLRVMTSIAEKQGILAHPDIAARLPSYPIFLFEVDGPAVVAKRGANEWMVLAPTFDEVSPHIHRIVDYLFYDTAALVILLEVACRRGERRCRLRIGAAHWRAWV
jgi:hypothetical protein